MEELILLPVRPITSSLLLIFSLDRILFHLASFFRLLSLVIHVQLCFLFIFKSSLWCFFRLLLTDLSPSVNIHLSCCASLAEPGCILVAGPGSTTLPALMPNPGAAH